MKKLDVELMKNIMKNIRKNKYIDNAKKFIRENEHINKIKMKIRENKHINSIKNRIKSNKYINSIKEYIDKNEQLRKIVKNKYFTPTISIVICFSIIAGLVSITKSFKTTKTVETMSIGVNAAEIDFYDGKFNEAIDEYTKMQEKDQWPIWTVKIAEIYSIKGEFVKSNEALRKAYQARNKIIDTKVKIENFEEKDTELVNCITFTSLMNGEYKSALEYGELFSLDYPNDKALLKTMFTTYVANGDKEKAKTIIGKYKSDDATASDLADLARMNILIDNMDEGLSLLKDAWNKDKNEMKVFDVIEQITDYNKTDALDRISKLQKKEPSELAYKVWTAKIYSTSKDSVENAKKLITELEDKDAGKVSLNFIKANVYDTLGDTKKLNEVLEEIIKNDEKSLSGLHAAAWLAYNKGNYDDAFTDCEKSIKINRDYSDSYTFLIPEIVAKQDKCEEAEAYFRTALYKDPFNYEVLLRTAEYYGNTLKNSNKSLKYYDTASKLSPNDAEIYYNMSLVKISNQREDEAIELLKKSISINSKIPKYHRALGTVYINKEKNEDGIKEIRNAYNLDKSDIKTLNNAGIYYCSVEGDISRGVTNLKAAYDGINANTSTEDKATITENYNRVKNLSDAYNKRNGTALKIPDLKLFY
ncbi:tetratricopeptide repeat protein [Clostridium saccharoperbutylacetonicum]|uniref:tetratricopeptide repeat protein n=1 Tax=Clostridium saccharoperbutylacetonicum TaxID=36745 RepID=UPI0039E8E74F